jgi:hypothetical protein
MKRIVLLIVLLLPAAAYAAPSITFETDTHDFGKVREGDKIEFSFAFENTGTGELVIEKLQAP